LPNYRPVILRKYIFPVQIVTASPEYDIGKKHDGSSTKLNRIFNAIKNEEGTYSLQIDLSLDKDKSVNPPYDFNFSVLGVFEISDKNLAEEQMKDLVLAYGSQILIGVLRERLALLTSTAPWGVFYLNFVAIPEFKYPTSGEVPVENLASMEQATKKRVQKKVARKKKVATPKKSVKKKSLRTKSVSAKKRTNLA
jgi:preprotein translocase subunit SecB